MTTILGLVLACALQTAAPRPDLCVADFESDTWGAWRATGDAFGSGPARGTLPNQMEVTGFAGRGLVDSFVGGDASTGTLTSPEFTLERDWLAFLIGGGKDETHTCLQLVVDGRVVRVATGPNDRPGGSEALEPAGWDVRELAGRRAVLRVVDDATGGWGHVNVDQIVQTDRKPPLEVAHVRRELALDANWLHLPIANGAKKRVVTLIADGRPIVRNEIELADGTPDWWAAMDVAAWRGKTIALEVDALRDDSTALSSIVASDAFSGGDGLYREALRPELHFSPRRGWNNDPNGLVFFRGEYHLFFQSNPYGWSWGNMHWGHAVSRDLVHWEELPPALAPDELGTIWSGSAIVDHDGVSGLGTPGEPVLLLFYTRAGAEFDQCLAWSRDGRRFTKYARNPIVKQITPGNRDPKVIRHAPSQRWVMALYVEEAGVHTIRFLTSADLLHWESAGRADGFFECPDLFELALDGDPARRAWVLTAASSEYQVGEFDGRAFTPRTPKLPGQRGAGFYAAQTFSDLPASDGRRIQIGWFQTETRGMPFNQSLTVPLELALAGTRDGPRLAWRPAKELETLRTKTLELGVRELAPGDTDPLAGLTAELVELRAEFAPGETSTVAFGVRGASVIYDAKASELVVLGRRAPAPLIDGRMRLTILCDRTGLEVFASDGLTYVPMPYQPDATERSLSLAVTGGAARFERLVVHELRSIWSR